MLENLERRTLLSGNVLVEVVNGTLVITGDNAANQIVIDQSPEGDVRVTAIDDTLVNGEQFPFYMAGPARGINVNLGGGDDVLEIRGVAVRGDLRIVGGAGNDLVHVARSTVRRGLFYEGHAGDDVLSVVDTRVKGLTSGAAGSGDDIIALVRSTFGWDVRLKGHAGDDTITYDTSTFARIVRVRPSAGHDSVNQAIRKSYDFRNGTQGWRAEFVDYIESQKSTYDMTGELRQLPAELGLGTGLFLSGDNHSDDLFMYLTRTLTLADGIEADRLYQVQFRIRVGSNAPTASFGVGGQPGESVVLKAGASAVKPGTFRDDEGVVRSTIDHGQQNVSGASASLIGSIENGKTAIYDGENEVVPYVTLDRAHVHTALVRAGSDGTLHLIVGTESGYEAVTALYYQQIDVTLVPV